MNDQITAGKNEKVVLLIHGYPEPIYKDSPIYKYFEDNGYTVIAPYLFTPDFKLTASESRKYIEEKLNGKKPEVIVGVSLGGLIAPSVAKDYPNAKLVMIATGPFLKTNAPLLDGIIEKSNKNFLFGIISTLKYIPTWLYKIVYWDVNNIKVTKEERKILENHIKQNWSCVTSISPDEDMEVINFLTSTNNSELLKSLKNKTIIFAGKEDVMMPVSLSEELSRLLVNSKLIISDSRLHYNVFTESEYIEMDEFLKSK